ncbi:Lysine acetyltransferase [Phytophthora citrophthora]|uniref:Lysine acetyltransferase n=1 Tax=Phytophthora citrophthora TaxID=4793 RepID=A0AAD9G2T0_9STRA|nr:Lysine acetyltransferase [Phytophthora citrophthora]
MEKFRLVQLTQEALKLQCKTDDYEHWGAPLLTVEEWQQKDATQRATPFSEKGALFWALVDKTEKDSSTSDEGLVAGQDLLYCHCKTLRFDCVYRRFNGDIERGYSYQVSSVYTLPAFRKRGLASFFLKEVAKQLEKLPNPLISVLYSDVGPTYYDRLGWKCHPSNAATLEVDHPRNIIENNDNSFQLEPMFIDDKLAKFLETDNARLVEELSSDKFQGKEAFLILPTRGSIEWQFVNAIHYARVAGYGELPSRCGVKINDNVFVLWWHYLKESTLYVSRARFPDSGDNAAATVRALLDTALQEARKFKLKKVVIWDPPSSLTRDEERDSLEIEVADRQLSLSSAMVFHYGNNGGNSTGPLPQWIHNENVGVLLVGVRFAQREAIEFTKLGLQFRIRLSTKKEHNNGWRAECIAGVRRRWELHRRRRGTTPANFATWKMIRNCPGRYIIKHKKQNPFLIDGVPVTSIDTGDFVRQAIATAEGEVYTVVVHDLESPQCVDRMKVVVFGAEGCGGGVITYCKQDENGSDVYVHTLNTASGLRRKLSGLRIDHILKI